MLEIKLKVTASKNLAKTFSSHCEEQSDVAISSFLHHLASLQRLDCFGSNSKRLLAKTKDNYVGINSSK